MEGGKLETPDCPLTTPDCPPGAPKTSRASSPLLRLVSQLSTTSNPPRSSQTGGPQKMTPNWLGRGLGVRQVSPVMRRGGGSKQLAAVMGGDQASEETFLEKRRAALTSDPLPLDPQMWGKFPSPPNYDAPPRPGFKGGFKGGLRRRPLSSCWWLGAHSPGQPPTTPPPCPKDLPPPLSPAQLRCQLPEASPTFEGK